MSTFLICSSSTQVGPRAFHPYRESRGFMVGCCHQKAQEGWVIQQAMPLGPAEQKAPDRDLLSCRRQSHPTLRPSVWEMQLLPKSRIQLLPEVPVSLLSLSLHLHGIDFMKSLKPPSVLYTKKCEYLHLPAVSLNHKTCCLTRPAASLAKGSRSTTSCGSAPLQNTPWSQSTPLPR